MNEGELIAVVNEVEANGWAKVWFDARMTPTEADIANVEMARRGCDLRFVAIEPTETVTGSARRFVMSRVTSIALGPPIHDEPHHAVTPR